MDTDGPVLVDEKFLRYSGHQPPNGLCVGARACMRQGTPPWSKRGLAGREHGAESRALAEPTEWKAASGPVELTLEIPYTTWGNIGREPTK